MPEHIPVLLNEVISSLNVKEDGVYLDFTVGRGGHSSEILKRLKNGKLIAFDQDDEAIKQSNINLSKIGTNYELVHTNFVNFKEELQSKNIQYVDGILADLGVSSPQFDQKDRGFSYREDAMLDMRMDRSQALTAHTIINTYSLEELTKIFQEYGDEKFSYSIAKNIIKAREKGAINTTFELVDIIKMSKPMKVLKKEGHPAKQVFQALRIAVNDEINVLVKALHDALEVLRPGGGRMAVITFHSGEDRVVKNIFKSVAVVEGNRYDGPNIVKEPDYLLVNRKPIIASEEELELNPRSKSAKLRVIERK